MRLNKYNNKRNFSITSEPLGIINRGKELKFCLQHHIARKDHYDFRLQYNGVLLSFAVPLGPSYNPKDKRLAIKVEDHPTSYIDFEGVIPSGQYGAGTVMLWDIGKYREVESFKKTIPKGFLKFELIGKRLKGKWTLIKYKDNNYLLIKEKDNIKLFDDINLFNRSIKTNRTMDEIKNVISITSKDKIIYKKDKITKEDIFDYYKKVSYKMLPYLKNRLLSVVRCTNGVDKFFKKHLGENKYLKKFNNFFYINNINGLLYEVQMNSIEFHIGANRVKEKPNIMVFDFDPDTNLSLTKLRKGVKELKEILDEYKLKSFLKTSGGKGYHVIVLFEDKMTWKKFYKIAEDISKLLEYKNSKLFTTNIKMSSRKNKIFIDYLRNKKGSTFVCPYSLRIKDKAVISMPIKWSELDSFKPDSITIKDALKRLKRKDPWQELFDYLN